MFLFRPSMFQDNELKFSDASVFTELSEHSSLNGQDSVGDQDH